MNDLFDGRILIAALAVRNQGSRLYGKPLQNLDVESGINILTNIINCLHTIDCINEVVLGVSEGSENTTFIDYAVNNDLKFIVGSEIDVLARLISCAELVKGTDVFRVTSESHFPSFDMVHQAWEKHIASGADATFYDDVIDGCGFEIIKLDALKDAHTKGEDRHRSELCTLYLRENADKFKLDKIQSPSKFIRNDLRLTVDNPEDLIVCKAVYKNFADLAPRIPLEKIVEFLDLNPNLIELTRGFTETGYESMYIWSSDD